MLNSLLLYFSCNNKIKYLPYVSMIAWLIVYLLKTDFSYGVMFPLACIGIFALVSFAISLMTKKKLNTFLSIISILVWSVLIDTVSFFMFPEYATSGYFMLVWNGILFNLKYVIVNIAAACAVYITTKALAESKEKQENN